MNRSSRIFALLLLVAGAGVAMPGKDARADLIASLQLVEYCEDDGTACNTFVDQPVLDVANGIWAQAGIEFVFEPSIQVNNSLAKTETPGVALSRLLADVSSSPGDYSGDFVLSVTSDSVTMPPSFSISVQAHIGPVVGGTVGIGTIFASPHALDTALGWSLAHTLGHMLGLPHADSANNLMRDLLVYASDFSLFELTDEQIAAARSNSLLTVSVPEPLTLLMLGGGLLGLAFFRRRRLVAG